MSSRRTVKTSIPIEQLGPPGIAGTILIRPVKDADAEPEQRLSPNTAPRTFAVSALLGKLPPSHSAIRADFSRGDGESYLLLHESAKGVRIEGPGGTFTLWANKEGEHSLLEFICTATSCEDAVAQLESLSLPFLDHLAFIANCPLFVHAFRAEDADNGDVYITYTGPYKPVRIPLGAFEYPSSLAPVFALYREAKNSNSDFYKVLCYHKLIDGLLGPLRADARKRAKASGIKLTQSTADRMPVDGDVPTEYQAYCGEPIKQFFDGVVRVKFRNAIAHFSTKNGDVLNASDPATRSDNSSIAYPCDLCVRTLVHTHLELESQLGPEQA